MIRSIYEKWVSYFLMAIVWLLVQSCYFEAENSDIKDTSTQQDTKYDDCDDFYDCDDEEQEAEEEPTGPELWDLRDIRQEQWICWDDFQKYVGDNYDSFCKCLVEKISIRWEFDDYKRHQYSYIKRLNDVGALARCNEPMSEWDFESKDDIKADMEWEPGDEPEPDTSEIMEPEEE